MEYAVENTLANQLHVVLFEESDKRDSFFFGYDFEKGMDLFAVIVYAHKLPFRGFRDLKIFRRWEERGGGDCLGGTVVVIPSLDKSLVASEAIEYTQWLVSFLKMNPSVHLLCSVDSYSVFSALNNALVGQDFPMGKVRVDTYFKDNLSGVPCEIDEDGWVESDLFMRVSKTLYNERVRLVCGLPKNESIVQEGTRPLGQYAGKMKMSKDFDDPLDITGKE